MDKQTVLEIIRNYLQVVNRANIQAKQAVLFGSWARGDAGEESDIDLVVLAPEFDEEQNYQELIDRLWRLRVEIPDAWRIEPIACGEREWFENTERPILEYARQEGEIITLEAETA